MFMALTVILMVAACGNTEGMNEDPDLPGLTVRVGGEEFQAAAGPYCWRTGNTTSCADASGDPFGYGDADKPITAAPGSEISFEFDRPPDSFTVLVKEEAGAEQPSAGPPFRLPEEPGKYGFMVSGEWPQGEVTFLYVVSSTVDASD